MRIVPSADLTLVSILALTILLNAASFLSHA